MSKSTTKPSGGRKGPATSVTTDNGATTLARDIGYLPFGPATSMTYGNSIPLAKTYDLDYQLSAMQIGSLFALTYGRDTAGHITSITDSVSPSRSQTFGYDPLHRLTSATGLYGTLGYTYDANSNRLSATASGQTDTYGYAPGTNRLASITGATPDAFSYDGNGNITASQTTTFTYNQNKRLIQAAVSGGDVTDYVINGLGQRVIKVGADQTTVYHYDKDGRLIAVTDDTGATLKEYVFLENTLLAVIAPTGITYAHTSHRGEPLALTDTAGTVAWRGAPAPFGAMEVDEDPDGDGVAYTLNVRLPGQHHDEETGLHYNYFRDYNPKTGQYMQADPAKLINSNDRYGYVEADPINYIDPLGLWKVSVNYYPGAGGGFDAGINPNGTSFFNMRTGYGFGGGITFDPNGTSSGYNDECANFQTNVGIFVELGANFQGFEAGYSAKAGETLHFDGSPNTPFGVLVKDGALVGNGASA